MRANYLFRQKQTSQPSMLLIQSQVFAFFIGYHDGIAQSTLGVVYSFHVVVHVVSCFFFDKAKGWR